MPDPRGVGDGQEPKLFAGEQEEARPSGGASAQECLFDQAFVTDGEKVRLFDGQNRVVRKLTACRNDTFLTTMTRSIGL